MKKPVNELDVDELHLFGLVTKAENVENAKRQRVATIHVNLLSKGSGENLRLPSREILQTINSSIASSLAIHCLKIMGGIYNGSAPRLTSHKDSYPLQLGSTPSQ